MILLVLCGVLISITGVIEGTDEELVVVDESKDFVFSYIQEG